jgi:hypothetical protein
MREISQIYLRTMAALQSKPPLQDAAPPA